MKKELHTKSTITSKQTQLGTCMRGNIKRHVIQA